MSFQGDSMTALPRPPLGAAGDSLSILYRPPYYHRTTADFLFLNLLPRLPISIVYGRILGCKGRKNGKPRISHRRRDQGQVAAKIEKL
ncbi:hypothetical protein M8C21_033215 [Ambrosia artemisiifolia]|uniref:Uncharacterized protein n=1 Tax=Ambrosia artemisiifolia TaxID=4212 RepID=A0AAD5GE77_AMBAR|nr:hypothetical protein M8C21_033215 [Ambrosia artemisiifolia]